MVRIKSTTARERIGRVGQRRQVVIPREMLEALNIREGDFVAFVEQKNGVLIKAKRLVDPDDTLTPAEAAIVRRGEAPVETLARRETCAGALNYPTRPGNN